MANHTGENGLVTVATNTVAELNGYSIDESAGTIDDSILGDAATTIKAGRTSWTGSIDCFWDDTDSTGQGAMSIGAEVAVVFMPEGDTSGDVTLTGSAVITGRSKAIAKDAMITQSFSLTGNGALVEGTVT